MYIEGNKNRVAAWRFAQGDEIEANFGLLAFFPHLELHRLAAKK